MTDKKKLANRIPFESVEEASAVSAWSLPSMESKARRVYSAKREDKAKKNVSAGTESVEDYKPAVKPKPLTAQDLQKLAAEAKQEGFDTGYQEGLQQGLQAGTARGEKEGEKKAYSETRKQLQDEITRLALISDHLFNPMEKQAQDLENIIIDMALRFTKELVAKEINEAPTYLIDLVRNALMALPAGASNIEVYCNQSDAELLEKYSPAANRNWVIKIDSAIASGGCRIETLESLVDYTLDHRLDAFLQQVREKGEVDPQDVDAPKDYVGEHKQAAPDEQISPPEAFTQKTSSTLDDEGSDQAELNTAGQTGENRSVGALEPEVQPPSSRESDDD